MNSNRNWLGYLSKNAVLMGTSQASVNVNMKSVPIFVPSPEQSLIGNSQAELCLVTEPLTEPALQLFGKMIGAMGQSSDSCATITKSESDLDLDMLRALMPKATYIVVFGSELAAKILKKEAAIGSIQEISGVKIMTTFDPQELLSNSELKKQAWGHLQQVISALT